MSAPITSRTTYNTLHPDRPGWIPDWVGDDWDPNPYAYQTEEEQMPAGRYHSRYLKMIIQLLDPLAERLGVYLLVDVFLFYRDWGGRKQRIGPDALIAPAFPELTEEQEARSYDLDVEPTPLFALELTSPESGERDQEAKRELYAQLRIFEYLVLDITDSKGNLRPQIGVTLWQLFDGDYVDVMPDAEGFVMLQSIGIRLRAEGRRLAAQVVATGEWLRTSSELLAALDESEQARQAAEQARQAAEQRATAEAEARQQAEAELAQLRAELARLRGATGADTDE
jgi:Uma2 family endonuclease